MLKTFFLLLAAGGVPLAIALLGAVLLHLLVSGAAPPSSLVQRLIVAVEGFPVAVPFFILTGQLMNNADTWSRIHDLALALVGWLRGGLGQVNVVSSAIFAGMSGTVIADAAGLGRRRRCASAAIRLIAALTMLGVARHARRHGHGPDVPFSRRRFLRAAAELVPFLLLPLLLWAAVQLGAPPQRSVRRRARCWRPWRGPKGSAGPTQCRRSGLGCCSCSPA